MSENRFKLLLGILAICLGVWIWQWVSGWGLVTIRATNEPVSKIIRSIERQGGVRVVTNADPEAQVSMEVVRVPALDAIDVLAARIDARWSVVFAAGPTKGDVGRSIEALSSGADNADFQVFRSWGGGGWMDTETLVDPRKVSWAVSPMDDPSLSSYLDQFAQKTGGSAITPREWNPSLEKVPKGGGTSASVIRDLIHSAGGKFEEVFFISVSRGGPDRGEQPFASGENASPTGQPPQGTRRAAPRTEWIQERAMAQIALLPKPEREIATRDFQEMQAFFEELRKLPQEERRAVMEARMSDPKFQDRMVQRETARDLKAGPERRAERYKRYIARKQERQNAQ